MDKVKKWLGFLLFIFSLSSLSLIISEPAKAIDFSSADYFSWTTTNSRVYTSDDYWSLNGASATGGIYRIGTFSGAGTGTISYLRLCTNSTIPGNSLVHFNITSYLDGKYVPISLNSRDSRMAFLNESFGEYGRGSYLFYLDSPASGCFDFGVNNQINAYWGGEVRFEVSGIDATTLSNDSNYSSILNDIKYLNQDQYNRLVDILSQGNGAATQRTTMITNLEDILEEIQGLDIEGSVETALENQREEEKQEIQNTSDEAENTADDAQDDVDGATSSLLSVLSNFLGVLTSVNPSNCYLDGSIFPHLNLGQLNLCENSPPAAITALGSLLLIAFVIPLVYNTIKMIINLFSEFQR